MEQPNDDAPNNYLLSDDDEDEDQEITKFREPLYHIPEYGAGRSTTARALALSGSSSRGAVVSHLLSASDGLLSGADDADSSSSSFASHQEEPNDNMEQHDVAAAPVFSNSSILDAADDDVAVACMEGSSSDADADTAESRASPLGGGAATSLQVAFLQAQQQALLQQLQLVRAQQVQAALVLQQQVPGSTIAAAIPTEEQA